MVLAISRRGFTPNPSIEMSKKGVTSTTSRQLVPTSEVIKATGLSRSTLHRWCINGWLEQGREWEPGVFPRSPRRWDLKALEARIEFLRINPPRTTQLP